MKRQNLEVLLGGPQTARELTGLVERAYQEKHGGLADNQREAYRKLLVDAGLGRLYLCRFAGECAGFASVMFVHSIKEGGRVALMEDFYLAPEFRKMDFAQRILQHVADHLSAFGLEVFCSLQPQDSAMRAVLRRLDFDEQALCFHRRFLVAEDDAGVDGPGDLKL